MCMIAQPLMPVEFYLIQHAVNRFGMPYHGKSFPGMWWTNKSAGSKIVGDGSHVGTPGHPVVEE
jgi:hypothetical protein